MKCLISKLMILLFLVSTKLIAADVKWNYKEGKITSGVVTIKDDNGNPISMNAHTQSTTNSYSTVPMLIQAGGGFEGDFALGLSDGTALLYKKSINKWLDFEAADFDSLFTYDSENLPLMTTITDSVSDESSISATIRMYTKSAAGTKTPYYDCYSTLTKVSETARNGVYSTEFANGSECSAYVGTSYGDQAYAGAYAQAGATLYINKGGYYSAADSDSDSDFVDDGEWAQCCGTVRAGVYMSYTQKYLNYKGVDRMFVNITASLRNHANQSEQRALSSNGVEIITLIGRAFVQGTPYFVEDVIKMAVHRNAYILDSETYLLSNGAALFSLREGGIEFIFNTNADAVKIYKNIKSK